ncbi:10311_t:CDS:2 [Paraglomus occultum]|uniref:10311_t:CDS:1 n=1 Tax=Paraglomus occultum TaxID=144539 RepID=A0A9N8YY28_9GLOM|nr:10311_t:CDS:2 [Paraglomus occultum]
MPRHSKNNTALSFFTYAESQALDYGTKKQRLGRDSMRNFDACFLCLQRARDPVCCSQGHLYCKECIYENLLAQKKEIKRQQTLLEIRQKEEEEKAKRKEDEAKEAVILDFERQQVRIAPLSSNKKSLNVTEADIDKNAASDTQTRAGTKRKIDETEDTVEGSNKKRNFYLDGDELRAIAQREHEEALKRLEEEKAEAAKPKLPNFWLPSLTPSADPDEVQTIKLRTVCTASDPEHPISIKALITTKWTEVEDANSKSFVCPSCRRTLTNTIKISREYILILAGNSDFELVIDAVISPAVMKPCGHVICSSCVDKFVKKSKKCFVCDVKCKDKDVIDMSGEGTGFASGGGKVVARKFDVAFQ